MSEEWRDITGYEGIYQVSSMGKVKRLTHIRIDRNGVKYSLKERMLRSFLNSKGYCMVALSKNGVNTHCSLHRIVAKAFIPNPENKEQVNHKNGDKTDNRAENLEWMTNFENIRHSIEVLGVDRQKTVRKPVMCVETGEIFPSQSAASRRYSGELSSGCRCSNGIRMALKNPTLTYKGCHWKYFDEL